MYARDKDVNPCATRRHMTRPFFFDANRCSPSLLPFVRCTTKRTCRRLRRGDAPLARFVVGFVDGTGPNPGSKGDSTSFRKGTRVRSTPGSRRSIEHRTTRCYRGGGFATCGDRSGQLVGGVRRGSRCRRRAIFDAWRSMDAVVDELDGRDFQDPPTLLVWEPSTQVGSRRTDSDSSMDGPDGLFSSHRRAAPSSAQGFPHLSLPFSRVSPNTTSGRTGSSRSLRLHPLTLLDVALGSGGVWQRRCH